MYNPMLATVLFGGCKGHEWTDHVLIYWIGSTFGALVASYIYPTIQKRIYSDEEKKMKWITNFVQLNFLSLSRLSKQSMIRQNNDLSFQKLYFLDDP